MRKQSAANGRATPSRSGVAAAEFAVCLPILLVIVIGTIEACSMIYLKQSLSVAAYEGVRAALKPGAETADVDAACKQILTARKVSGATVTITPGDFASRPEQTWITVRVVTTGGANSVISGWSYDNLVIDGEATMMKEFD
ncbi:MAG: TadE family protein [Fuerstiella sp.]